MSRYGSSSTRYAGDVDVSPVVSDSDSVSQLQAAKELRDSSEKQRNTSRDNFHSQYGNFNLAEEKSQSKSAKANYQNFQGNKKDFINRQQSGENKYDSWKEFNSARRDARGDYKTQNSVIRDYNSAKKQKVRDHKRFISASNNYNKLNTNSTPSNTNTYTAEESALNAARMNLHADRSKMTAAEQRSLDAARNF